MSKPFIFIGTHQIAEGKLDEFKRDCQQLVEVVERNEPQLLSFNFYFSEDESEVSVVQVHPDADSMLLHMQLAREHITGAAEEQLVTKDIQVFWPTERRGSRNHRAAVSVRGSAHREAQAPCGIHTRRGHR
jgi:quinol monooxygenase YgiN